MNGLKPNEILESSTPEAKRKMVRLFTTKNTYEILEKLSVEELKHLKYGSKLCAAVLFGCAYYAYRQHRRNEYVASAYLYKLTNRNTFDAGNQWWFGSKINSPDHQGHLSLYYRMPELEFNRLYKMRAGHITGYFDHTKEILFPHKKDGRAGYRVITPFYYYRASLPDLNSSDPNKNLYSSRAGMAVDRGWIPTALADRRLRPHDLNKQSETLYGIVKHQNNTTHNFTEPNDPTRKIWTNFCLEDFATYWELSNIPEAKFVYFQELNFGNLAPETSQDVFPKKSSIKDAIVQTEKEKGFHLDRNYKLYQRLYTFGGLFFSYLYFLSA